MDGARLELLPLGVLAAFPKSTVGTIAIGGADGCAAAIGRDGLVAGAAGDGVAGTDAGISTEMID